jgi:dihydrodipicolinate synthase/N-acetylneuraminate lyase
VFTLENYRPRGGLVVPSLTVFRPDGAVDEEGQHRLFRHLAGGGFGADVVFAAGTNGEWPRLEPGERRLLARLAGETITEGNRELVARGHLPIEAWGAVTGGTRAETIENLREALRTGLHAGVLAPLSIRDSGDLFSFVHRDMRREMDRTGRHLPVFLYDNADLSVDPRVAHLRTREVKRLSRIDFVRGVKVTASIKVLGNYTRAASHFNSVGHFGIYMGNALLMFDVFCPDKGALRKVIDQRLLYYSMPIGVVSGYANLWPREWQGAWQSCRAGDGEQMAGYRRLFEALREACVFEGDKKTIACLKFALFLEGVIPDPSVRPGTPALTDGQKRVFEKRYGELVRMRGVSAPEQGPGNRLARSGFTFRGEGHGGPEQESASERDA